MGWVKHNKSHTPEYKAWSSMRERCHCKTNVNYKNYGARGIGICDEWNEFSRFLSDMGARPSSDHSIDRIDNNKGYCKENCRWATRTQQGNNRRTCYYISAYGVTLSITEWSRVMEVPLKRYKKRREMGWNDFDLIFKQRVN